MNTEKAKYKVHRFDLDMEKDAVNLEKFLNGLQGMVVSIVPHVDRTSLPQIYGLKRKVDFLLIVERV